MLLFQDKLDAEYEALKKEEERARLQQPNQTREPR